jgi:hypothetical protein
LSIYLSQQRDFDLGIYINKNKRQKFLVYLILWKGERNDRDFRGLGGAERVGLDNVKIPDFSKKSGIWVRRGTYYK